MLIAYCTLHIYGIGLSQKAKQMDRLGYDKPGNYDTPSLYTALTGICSDFTNILSYPSIRKQPIKNKLK